MFRYDKVAREFDAELLDVLNKHAAERQAKQETGKSERLPAIGQAKTPLDEVRALIDASRAKSAAQEVAEFRVRQKLAAIKRREIQAVTDFVATAERS